MIRRPPRSTLFSLHDALPIWLWNVAQPGQSSADLTQSPRRRAHQRQVRYPRSEEHTSELQSLAYLVCRLLLEKKNSSNNNLFHTFDDHLPINAPATPNITFLH